MDKTIKWFCFNSRLIINYVFVIYLVLLVFLKHEVYDHSLPVIYSFLFLFLLGLALGMHLMAIIIKYLSKQSINR